MSLNLPERASYEYLKKLAKDRLALLRTRSPATKLADAQFAIAQEYGFSSWRALKAEIDHRRAPNVAGFIRGCTAGDVAALRELLAKDPGLARERVAAGSTGLHLAVRHPEALRLLIEHGADPNVRDVGDNASPLHFAAANGSLESVRLLLDAGADVHGAGDLHKGDVIGWATREGNQDVIDLLLERGARHHIFSAMALGDRDLVQKLVEEDPGCLERRRSRFESGQTPLHAAFAPPDGLGFLAGKPDYLMLDLLIELGADIDARDDKGRTSIAVAMLRGDREAMRLLKAAGAAEPESLAEAAAKDQIAAMAGSVKKGDPMFWVTDMRATVRWYESIGFTVVDRYEDGGELMFAKLSFGKCEFGLSPGGKPGPRDVSLWFYTDRVQELYHLLKDRQLRVAQAVLTRSVTEPEVRFNEDLYVPFYGGRQFSIQDNNGLSLIFWQPDWFAPSAGANADS
jgi:ankyrin repeat protein/catechol 2,3-dioxygenase-like lactoylglutathione lyase family enzyme